MLRVAQQPANFGVAVAIGKLQRCHELLTQKRSSATRPPSTRSCARAALSCSQLPHAPLSMNSLFLNCLRVSRPSTSRRSFSFSQSFSFSWISIAPSPSDSSESALAGTSVTTGIVARVSPCGDAVWVRGLAGVAIGEVVTFTRSRSEDESDNVDAAAAAAGAGSAASANTENISEMPSGIVQVLLPHQVGVAMLRHWNPNSRVRGVSQIQPGNMVHAAGHTMDIARGPFLLGRVIDPLGRFLDIPASTNQPTDVLGELAPTSISELENSDSESIVGDIVPLAVPRVPFTSVNSLDQRLHTGVLVLDQLAALARGDSCVLVGRSGTGKVTLALDVVIGQRLEHNKLPLKGAKAFQTEQAQGNVQEPVEDSEESSSLSRMKQATGTAPVFCVYVAVGVTQAELDSILVRLRDGGALEYTSIVAALDTDTDGMKQLAPQVGVRLAEWYREQRMHSLVIVDNWNRHAKASFRLASAFRSQPAECCSRATPIRPGSALLEAELHLQSSLLERAGSIKNQGTLTMLTIAHLSDQDDADRAIAVHAAACSHIRWTLDPSLFVRGIRPALNLSRCTGGDLSRSMPWGLNPRRWWFKMFKPYVEPFLRSEVPNLIHPSFPFLVRVLYQLFGSRGVGAIQSWSESIFRLSAYPHDPLALRCLEIVKQNPGAPRSMAQQYALLHAVFHDLLDSVPIEQVSSVRDAILEEIHLAESSGKDFKAQTRPPDWLAMRQVIEKAIERVRLRGTKWHSSL